jgi:NAD(P)-dependent dehydrogenase (short-subunit alcohol dehydrogenase family)
MDVTDGRSVREGIDRILERTGRLDVAVNCAGYGIAGPIESTSIDEAKKQFETNFFGALRVCQSVLPIFRQQRSGLIVNVSSLAGRIGVPFQGMYSASKFALEGLTEALRMELKPLGLHACLIEPGDFRTEFTANRQRVASDGQEAYRTRADRALSVAASDEANGAPPERIAHLLFRILRDPSPKLRYTAGDLSQRISASLKPFLPAGVFERGVMTHYRTH